MNKYEDNVYKSIFEYPTKKIVELELENEQLEEELKYSIGIVEHNQIVTKLSKEKKQLENNRDKAIEICDFYNKKYQKDPLENQKVLFVISNIMDILKGDSDDE